MERMTIYLDELEAEKIRLEEENKRLEEENGKLKTDLEQFSEAYKRYRDFEKEELAESCYDLAKENKKLKDDLEHSDSFFSLMRDVLTNENVSSYALWDIVNAVVKEECGAEDELDEEDLEIVKKFWNGYYRTF